MKDHFLENWYKYFFGILTAAFISAIVFVEPNSTSKEYANVSVYENRCGFRTYHDKTHRVSVTQELTDKELKCIIVLSK